MHIMFIEGKSKIKPDINRLIAFIRGKFSRIAVFSSIQYVKQAETIVEGLINAGIKVILSKAARAKHKLQLLGCDCDYENLNLARLPDAFLYIGDGDFHPLALALAQRYNKKYLRVIVFNPYSGSVREISRQEISRTITRYKAGLIRFLSTEKVGVIISIKPGQEQLEASMALPKLYPDKRFYFFIADTIIRTGLEDFNFIDMWINSACPRIGFEDGSQSLMINLSDALNAKEALSRIIT